MEGLTDAELREGWEHLFLTENPYDPVTLKAFTKIVRWVEALRQRPGAQAASEPLDMLLYCPNCGTQHVDAPEQTHRTMRGQSFTTTEWANPPHRSHLCHDCGCIWRPADVPTNGVGSLRTQGSADTWPAVHNEEVRATPAGERPAQVEPMTDAQIDRMLDTVVPGGSQARDWFLPHESEKGLANVRDVIRRMFLASQTARERPGAQAASEPVFWYRPCGSDGGYEGPLHHSSIEDVRKRSGAWVPLYPRPAGERPAQAEPMTWIAGQPPGGVEMAWLHVQLMGRDEEGGDDQVQRVILGVLEETYVGGGHHERLWGEAGDWRGESVKDCIHDDGGVILAWMPYTIPALASQSARERPGAQAPSTAACDGGQCGAGGYCKECPLAAPSTGGAETAGWRFDDSRPDTDEVVLVVYRTNPRHEHGGKPSIHRARFSGGQWRFIDDAVQERRQDGVVCWMPLPPIPGIHEAPASSAPAQAVETAGVREALEAAAERALMTLYMVLSYPEFDCDNQREPRPLCAFAREAIDALTAALQSPAASPASKEDGSATR